MWATVGVGEEQEEEEVGTTHEQDDAQLHLRWPVSALLHPVVRGDVRGQRGTETDQGL